MATLTKAEKVILKRALAQLWVSTGDLIKGYDRHSPALSVAT